jgi:exodeoxyribonuclease VIII
MIYENKSFTDYTAMPGLNQSKLGMLRRCPQKFKHALNAPREDTDTLAIGRAIHTAALQPELFNGEFLCLPDIDRRTTKGREEYAALVAANPDKTVLKASEFNKALEIATEIRSNKHVMRLLDGAFMELSVDWTDEATGVLCKARLDAYNEDIGTVIDIKTTIDASPQGFARKLYSYGYNRQAAWYLESLKAHNEAANHFVFIAVEKEPPYSIGLYRLSDEAIKLSRTENQALLRRYAECLRTDCWPGYTDGVEDISIPTYGVADMEEQYGTIDESL